MNSRLSMSSLEVNSPRIDAHVLAKGMFELKDYVNSGTVFLDENISDDEIRKVIGYMIDLQASRFEGHSPYQSTMILAYVHKEYEFKNEFFANVVKSFVSAFIAIEECINSILLSNSSFWTRNEKFSTVFHQVDKASIRSYLINCKTENSSRADIIDLCLFELDFAGYLPNYRTQPVPVLPELPILSSDIGAIPSIHFRDLPYQSPPPKPQVMNHNDSCMMMKSVVNYLSVLKDIPKVLTMSSLLDLCFQWGKNNQKAAIFVRVLYYGYILQSKDEGILFDTEPFNQMIVNELNEYHIPLTVMKVEKDTPSLTTNLLSFFDQTLKALMFPSSYAHAILVKYSLPMWGFIQKFLYSLMAQLPPESTHYPKTNSQPIDQIVHSSSLFLTSQIAVQLACFYFDLGFGAEIFLAQDVLFSSICFKYIFESLETHLEKFRTVNTVYSLYDKRKTMKKKSFLLKSQDIIREKGDQTAIEHECKAVSHFMMGSFVFLVLAIKNKAIITNNGQYYSLTKAFRSRMSSFSNLVSIQITQESNFEAIYNEYNSFSNQKLINEVKRQWEEAKKELALAMKSEKTQKRTDILKFIIMSSTALLKWKEGDSFVIQMNGVFPLFTLQSK